MDLQLSNIFQANQYAFHGIVVGLVIVSAILVYVFGFKPPVEPPFDKLTNPHDERKANGKKRKTKEKKPQSNGHVTGIGETKKEVVKKDAEKSPNKDKKTEKKPALKENTPAKPVNTSADAKKKGKGKENVEIKNKKNKVADEKPKDFDDGEWEQAPSRKDKKNKKNALEEILPAKTEKKKEQKKKKDEEVKQDPPAAEPPAPAPTPPSPTPTPPPTVAPVSPPEPPTETPAPKNEVESDSEGKPKRQRKKKPAAPPVPVTDAPATPEEKPAPTPKPEPPAPAPKIEPPTEIQPVDTSVAFDELGDTWKEARAPKKGSKKKSRKE